MTRIKLILLLLIPLLFQSCGDEKDCIVAAGEVQEDELFLDSFTKVGLEIPADVYIRKGDEQQVLIEAQQEIIDQLLGTAVVNGGWDIGWDGCFQSTESVKIYITVPALEQVGISGSGRVIVEDQFIQSEVILRVSGSGSIAGNFQATNMDCSISGSGGIQLEGSAGFNFIRISGSGSAEAFGIQTVECGVSISGSGSANVTVSELLDVSIEGSGSVRYKGNPNIITSISGSGQVIDAN